jgi:cytochrome b pre-mRNA-processing protein 3
MLQSLFKPRPAKAAGQALYSAIAAQARDPRFYLDLGAPDRIDARFELYCLHLALLLERLSEQGEEAEEIAQATLDAYVSSLDDVLREGGVGDLSMAKKMKTVASLLMGRLKAVRDGLSPADPEGLQAYLDRTVYAEAGESADPGGLADYAIRANTALAAQPLDEILRGRPAWPAVS